MHHVFKAYKTLFLNMHLSVTGRLMFSCFLITSWKRGLSLILLKHRCPVMSNLHDTYQMFGIC
jgi:hypothetical protein